MPVLLIHPSTPQEKQFSWTGEPCTIGRSATNLLQIDDELISSFHARIEPRGAEYWLVDLSSTNGTFLNGAAIREVRLQNGDLIALGENVKFRFTLPPAPAPTFSPPEPVVTLPPQVPAPTMGEMGLQQFHSSAALAPQGVVCPSCRTLVPFQVNFCPRCGMSLAPQGALGFPAAPQPVGFVRPQDQPGGMSIGLLPVLALLCGVFGVFPFAIILGLTALGQIRRLGGMESDRKQALWGVGLGFFWALVALGIGGYYGWGKYQEHHRVALAERQVILDKQIAENEANAITVLKSIARAQRLVKIIRFQDPNHTGKGQYLALPELAAAGTAFLNRDLATGQAQGYAFRIVDPSEGRYVAVAEPVRYGETGRRVLTVDSSGLIRGKDTDGKTYAQLTGTLPVLSDVKSAFEGVDDAIAAEAITHAKKLAEQGKYEECRVLLDDLATQFAMTSVVQELSAIKKTVDPFIIEAQAQRKHQKVADAIAAGDTKLAIALLKEIAELYPTYSKISAVTEELNQYDTALVQKLDKEAKALFEKAEALERDGKPEGALDVYVQIEKNYPGTEYAKRIGELRPALLKSIRETSAEQLFAQARELPVTNDFRNVVNLIQQLQRNYADTDYVTVNKDSINILFQKALAEFYRNLALEQMKAGRDADALARLEEACGHNPDSRTVFRDLFIKLYLRVARKREAEGDFREALRLYRSYLALEPDASELNPAVLSKLQFALARSEFAQGSYYAAAQLLVGARKEFEKDADFNDLFASVQVALGNYLDALPYFDKAIATKPNNGNFYARRGYAQLLFALQTERESLAAYAGLLRDTTPQPGATSKPAKTDTNASPLEVRIVLDNSLTTKTNAAPTTTDDFGPVFATLLPQTASGVKPEMQVRYDAVASQALLERTLDFLDGITASNTTTHARSIIQQNPGRGRRGNNPDGSPGSDRPDGVTGGPTRTSDRINRIKSSVEFNKALSSLRQRIADSNGRQAKSAEAMRRMIQCFTTANRDLNKAIELGADRAPDLMEIAKAAQQHERKVTQAVPLIISYIATEIDVIERLCGMVETVYQSLRVQHNNTPMDPTTMLDIYLSRYFDRRDFDRGIQILREAGSVKVPLETYSLVPVTAPSTALAPNTTPKPVKPAPATPTPATAD